MLIAIPSKGRAGQTTSDKLISSAVLFVPQSELHQYETTNPSHKLVPIPNKVKGITKARNWILKNSDSPRVVFLDDDVKSQGWTKLYSNKSRKKEISESQWINEFKKLFDITESFKYKIFGIKTEDATRSVYPTQPIQFRGYVTASCMGIINDGSYYFDESYAVKEDYEICLRHIKKEGGIIAARYLHWQNSHWGDEGGCKDYRTQSTEAKCIRKLVKEYPGMIRQIKRGGSEYSIELNF